MRNDAHQIAMELERLKEQMYELRRPKNAANVIPAIAAGELIQGKLQSLDAEGGGDFPGIPRAQISVELGPCPDEDDETNTLVWVYDHSECIFDHPEEDLLDVWVFAGRVTKYVNQEAKCHFATIDRCCVEADFAQGPVEV